MEKLHFITPFPMTIGNLPASYDESLSYLQKLLVLQKKLQEIINNVNQLISIVNNFDFNVDEINDKIDKLNQDFIIFENRINNEVNAKLNQNYNQVLNLMQNYQAIFDGELAQLQSTLENQIQQIELGNVEAYNPTTGTFENVSKVIMDIYSILRNNAITCTEYDTLELTATAYDALEITAYNFDVNGKEFLDVA